MVLAFDAFTESIRTDTSDPWEFQHSTVAAPKLVVVTAIHGDSEDDHVAGITYGGVPLTRLITATNAGGVAGRSDIWYSVHPSIPSGNQSVSVSIPSGTGEDLQFVVMTFTSVMAVISVDSDSQSGTVSDPAVTMQQTGRSCIAVGALFANGTTSTEFTPNGSCTTVASEDLGGGTYWSTVIRQTTVGSTDFTIGGSLSSTPLAYVAGTFTDTFQIGTPMGESGFFGV